MPSTALMGITEPRYVATSEARLTTSILPAPRSIAEWREARSVNVFVWAMGISPIMLRLCVPKDVSCAPSFSVLSVELANTSRMNARALGGMGTSRRRMPYASASARISCILFREPASARPLAQPLQWVIQVRLVAARNVSSSSARRRR